MHTIRYDDRGFRERIVGDYDRTEDILVSPEMTESSMAVAVRMKKGFKTETHSHTDQEQIYLILQGSCVLTVDGDSQTVEEGMAAFIPRNASHRVVAISQELVYVYLGVWPKGKPKGLKPRAIQTGKVLDLKFDSTG